MILRIILACLLLASPVWAARDFNGTTDKITASTTPITAAPNSISCMFNRDDTTGDEYLGVISDTGSASRFFKIGTNATPIVFSWTNEGAANGTAVTSTSYSSGSWFVASFSEASSTSRAVYLDGGGKGTNTTSVVPTSIDSIAWGVNHLDTDSLFLNGLLAECAMWNRSLSDAEHASLGKLFSPNCFRRGLVNYTPMVRDIQDQAKNITYSTTGTTVATHPRVFYCF